MSDDANRIQFRPSKRTRRQLAELAVALGFTEDDTKGELMRQVVNVAHVATFGQGVQAQQEQGEAQ
jgi:hypothetical protein